MIKIKEYVMAESLEQAYELNQKKRNCIIGGMLWLKMGNRMVPTAIDLSNLGLNTRRLHPTCRICQAETGPGYSGAPDCEKT